MDQIRIKVDEDLPAEVADVLRAAGHDASSVVEQGLTGKADDHLWLHVQRESRILFTADKGFADVRQHPPGTHRGIVLFRLPRESRAGYLRLITVLLEAFHLEDAMGAIVVVSPDVVRVHKG